MSVFFSSCRKETVPKEFRPNNEHQAYLHSLKQANLLRTALGKDWADAAKTAIDKPILVSTPYQEMLLIDSSIAFSEGYRFSAKEGQTIEVTLDYLGSDSTLLFLDAYRIDDKYDTYSRVASSNKLNRKIQFTTHTNSDYTIRLQTELLRGGKCLLKIILKPSLKFPLEGKGISSIGGLFGDPRDGGKREHHGVDIFGKRNTPIYAPIDGYISRVGESDMGGLYVWLRNPKNRISLYFAHLQTQSVKVNTSVKAGDLLGSVGNTGNAKNTPPHLHFGIYGFRRAINPYYYLQKLDTIPKTIICPKELLGDWVIASKAMTQDNFQINKKDRLKIIAASGKHYRVINTKGQKFLVNYISVEPIKKVLL